MSTTSQNSSPAWSATSLRDVLRFQVGFPFSSAYFSSSPPGVRLVRNRDLRADDAVVYYKGPYDPQYLVHDGDVLIGMDGDFEPCVWHGGVALLNQRVGRIQVSGRASARFMAYALEGPLNALESATGATTVKHLSHVDVERMNLVLPAPPEQRRIAETLADIDDLIALLDHLITKKQAIKQGIMQELLTGMTRLPGFSGHWTESTYRDLVQIQRGEVLRAGDAASGDVPVIAAGRTPATFTDRSNRAAPVVTISASGASAGYVAFHSSPIFASDCSTISSNANVDLVFVYYSLVLRQEQIYRAQTGGAQPHVHAKDIYPMLVKMPPSVDEQRAIGEVLSEADAEIRTLVKRLNKARSIKQGMMQELLSGRTRLPVQEVAS